MMTAHIKCVKYNVVAVLTCSIVPVSISKEKGVVMQDLLYIIFFICGTNILQKI